MWTDAELIGLDYAKASDELADQLTQRFPEAQVEDSEWMLGTNRDVDYAWQVSTGDKPSPSLPVLRKDENGEWKPIQGLKYKISSGVTLHFRDNYLLVTRMGTRPYIVDLTTHKIVYKSANASGVLFWPRMKKPVEGTEPNDPTVPEEAN